MHKHRSLTIVACTALLSLPAGAMAAERLGYTWVEADYVNLDIDAFDENQDLIEDLDDGDGWALRGSFAFTQNFFVFAGYSSTDSDATFFDDDNFPIVANVDIERGDAGVGYNMPLGGSGERQTDLVFRAAYSDIDYGDFAVGASPGDDSFDDLDDDSSDGWFTDASLRAQLASWFEGAIGVRYTDIETADNFSVIGNALFEITPRFGINVEADVGDDVSTYMVGLRYTFDRI
jgi:hypothetical protein